jgi:hypothetical protein
MRQAELARMMPEEERHPWARRQGFADRQVGKPCRKYKDFLITYDLPESKFTLSMWIAYKPPEARTQVRPGAGTRLARLIP